MASVTKNDIPNEAKMIGMLWELIKEFYVPEDSDEYHQAFCDRAREIDRQCNSRLGQELINGFGKYLDGKYEEDLDGRDTKKYRIRQGIQSWD